MKIKAKLEYLSLFHILDNQVSSFLLERAMENFSVFLPGYLPLLLPSVDFLFLFEFVQEPLVYPHIPPSSFP